MLAMVHAFHLLHLIRCWLGGVAGCWRLFLMDGGDAIFIPSCITCRCRVCPSASLLMSTPSATVNSISMAGHCHSGMGWWATIRVRLARIDAFHLPWVQIWAGRTAVMRWKSESMADSGVEQELGRADDAVPASPRLDGVTLSPNWGPG